MKAVVGLLLDKIHETEVKRLAMPVEDSIPHRT